MKELIKTKLNGVDIKSKDTVMAVVYHIEVAIIGFISSRAVVRGLFVPFGLSFLAGCPQIYTPAMAIGVFIGYFIPAVGNGGFRYISAMLAILAIKLMLSNYKKIIKNPFFLSGICLMASAITSVVTLNGLASSFVTLVAESVMAGGGTFFVCRTSRAIERRSAGLSGDEMASLLIVISILLMGVSNTTVYGISLGRILGIFLILTSAKYGGTLSGAVSGIAVSFSAALTGSGQQGYLIYSFGGMMTGVFSSLGKYAQIAALVASALVGTAFGGFNSTFAPLFVEIILGSALFLLIPRSAGINLGKLFSCYPKVTAPTGIKKALTLRLTMASGALSDVSQTVEQVSKQLSKINSPDFSKVMTHIENDACAGCKLRLHCWESKKEDTVSAILEMTKAVKQGEYSPAEYAPDNFKGRCLRINKMGEAVYKNYSQYASRISAQNRIEEVRSVVSDQFDGISNMLIDLAEDFSNDEQFDNAAALSASAALKNIDIRVDECSSRIDKYGRMTIEFKMKKTGDTVINKLQVMKTLSIVCERDFDVPTVYEAGGEIFISVSEHAVYSVDIGVSQISASNSNMCGDAYNYFNDGKGHFVMILSDGMGTGGRAAVDGAMASGLMSRLLKAGFGYDCSLRILNSSMLFKSTDESLATVDIASIDLFTGEAELYKAGAAPTIVRRFGKTGKAVSTSLPIGILSDIGFDRAGIRMSKGDIMLIMSDGAVSEGTEWICAELEAWRDGSAEDLADHISECARRRRSDNHEDDITVMAAIIEKAV